MTLPAVGAFRPGASHAAVFEPDELAAVAARVREPVHVVYDVAGARLGLGVATGGEVLPARELGPSDFPLVATLPATYPEWLGDRSFNEAHGVRFPYVAGEMANGIATARMVVAMAEAGMLGFFGAAGLSYERVEQGLDAITAALPDGAPWGVNLIHSPAEPELEERVADLLIRRGVLRISASAFMELAPSVVRCSAAGLSLDAAGRVVRRHHVFAKISRAEVAAQFMSPPPSAMLRALVAQGKLTHAEAELASRLPVAEDITVEADSGGHTDNQTLVALFPLILSLRNELTAKHGFTRAIRVGAAGGLGTPSALAAAFALGAAYVVTGTVNQSAVEAGLSDAGKRMLAEAGIADVAMAAAADMFELGVKLQVLKRGTLFASRANTLYEIYRAHDSLESLPADVRTKLETRLLGATLDAVWRETEAFWAGRDPGQLAQAASDPKHRMALVFRWYLGKSSRWAIEGDPARRADYQIWCGPAMGAFNGWVKGSFLEDPAERTVVQIALNLLEGAVVAARAQHLRAFGVPVPSESLGFRPRRLRL
ncbi:MAG TPA: PfaD family polyunsaturated fatty acid/polyketide biosynthesis protein [Polyangiaceae bacterium]|nr:PfaD family polyunsaturated fatty acid/polyketide biosynthesis protein [Polyangiaceae bacterium]